jgi:hypothetical protein
MPFICTKYKVLLIFTWIVLFSSCTLSYKFNQSSIPADVKTFSVQYFENRAPLIQPTLSQTFTESLKNKFLSRTRLDLVSSSGDFSFEGEITGYSTAPMAIQGNETAGMNRLTINVHVKFSNQKDQKQDFDQSFSSYQDYDSSQNLADVEDGLITSIVDKLTDDIFNRSAANW